MHSKGQIRFWFFLEFLSISQIPKGLKKALTLGLQYDIAVCIVVAQFFFWWKERPWKRMKRAAELKHWSQLLAHFLCFISTSVRWDDTDVYVTDARTNDGGSDHIASTLGSVAGMKMMNLSLNWGKWLWEKPKKLNVSSLLQKSSDVNDHCSRGITKTGLKPGTGSV